MNYGSTSGPGATLAATGFTTGYYWLVITGLVLVVAGALLIRLTFRRGVGPVER
ncbi:LPXTG-motif cell wall-anchored protein [Lipingzhangella halophila]|uniref:LPXTG-motif cell wall-anchored protein n=1 Tax=Lipingzhangella halophila TaxID=1783352 RepID=A0A7W7REM3_9ACTN|nr:LPXTG cell wall anchor domain-containing protein [Lipingzhangella halophila]MBB4930565.1 LPXTG-motif cell wall-anchored protein [Lipingzhangella halophila]